MNLSDILQQIESRNFSANLNVASGLSVVRLGLKNDTIVQQLISDLQQSPDHQREVFQRVLALLKANDQPDYAHPYDAALAAYLYALNQVNADLTQQAIRHILQTPKLWWARRLATHIQESLTPAS
jgi:hypothetical protein